MSTILVRLKPYDRKAGHVLRTFTVYSMRFKEKHGWYEVEKEIADLLRDLRQPRIGDRPAESMPHAFDIMSQAEALAHEEAQRKLREARAKAISPHKLNASKAAASKAAVEAVEEKSSSDLTTKDLPGNPPAPAKPSRSRRRSK